VRLVRADGHAWGAASADDGRTWRGVGAGAVATAAAPPRGGGGGGEENGSDAALVGALVSAPTAALTAAPEDPPPRGVTVVAASSETCSSPIARDEEPLVGRSAAALIGTARAPQDRGGSDCAVRRLAKEGEDETTWIETKSQDGGDDSNRRALHPGSRDPEDGETPHVAAGGIGVALKAVEAAGVAEGGHGIAAGGG
jgi:hypothetical protein